MAQRKRKRSSRIAVREPEGGSFQSEFQSACAAAVAGKIDEAGALFDELCGKYHGKVALARIENARGVIAAIQGDVERAHRQFTLALQTDAGAGPAQENQATLARWSREVNRYAQVAEGQACLPAGSEQHPIPTKVAILSFLFNWPTSGGGNVHTVELAKFLSAAGFEVRHWFARFEPWGIGRVDESVPFASKALAFDERTWDRRTIQARFRDAVAQFDPDYVVISDSWNFKPLLAQAVREYPFILRLQALECLCPLNNVRLLPNGQQCAEHQFAAPGACHECLRQREEWSGPLHRLERQLCGVGTAEYDAALRLAFRQAEAVLAVNPLTEAMLGPYCRKICVVPSGFDPERFPVANTAPRASPADGRVRVFLAAVVGEAIKGFDVLHAACQRLWAHRQDFELLVTGDPCGQVDEFTRFIGWQSQGDLPERLREIDILAVPAVAQEALGRTAVEGMAAGRPVVASRIGGLPYTIADGAGLLVRPGDPDDLADKLEFLIERPALRAELGRLGRKRFEEHFTWPVIIERHYRSLLSRRRAGYRAPCK